MGTFDFEQAVARAVTAARPPLAEPKEPGEGDLGDAMYGIAYQMAAAWSQSTIRAMAEMLEEYDRSRSRFSTDGSASTD